MKACTIPHLLCQCILLVFLALPLFCHCETNTETCNLQHSDRECDSSDSSFANKKLLSEDEQYSQSYGGVSNELAAGLNAKHDAKDGPLYRGRELRDVDGVDGHSSEKDAEFFNDLTRNSHGSNKPKSGALYGDRNFRGTQNTRESDDASILAKELEKAEETVERLRLAIQQAQKTVETIKEQKSTQRLKEVVIAPLTTVSSVASELETRDNDFRDSKAKDTENEIDMEIENGNELEKLVQTESDDEIRARKEYFQQIALSEHKSWTSPAIMPIHGAFSHL